MVIDGRSARCFDSAEHGCRVHPKHGAPDRKPLRCLTPAGGRGRIPAGMGIPEQFVIEGTAVMSVELNPYLFFPGNAEEAINFYQLVFGGQVEIFRVGDVDQNAPAERRNLVINAQLTGGDITLRASDRDDSSTEPQTRVELSLIGTDEARLSTLFDSLSEGGIVRAKLERQFWGDIFGMVTDKYGIGWQVNIGQAGT